MGHAGIAPLHKQHHKTHINNRLIMRLALLTSNHIRHKYFARVLAEAHELAVVVAEDKGNQNQLLGQTEQETRILQEHFTSLETEQVRHFGNLEEFPSSVPTVMHVPRGEINNPEVVQMLKKSTIEGIAVFGCGMLRAEIFNLCPGAVINAHQGISPYYRGSGTNFWPFVNKELHCVGVTVHYIDAGIDTGGIICHGRPDIVQGDTLHGIGCKTVACSASLVARVFREMEQGNRPGGIAQWQQGRLYQRKDFNAQAVMTARQNMEAGLVERYLDALSEGRQPRIQLVDLR
jgi:methionyl-tRNA formyltransferase